MRNTTEKNQNKKKIKTILALALVLAILVMTPAKTQASISCKKICSVALKATGGYDKIKYQSSNAMDFGALSFSARKKVKSIQYVFDSKEAYSMCVIEAKNSTAAKALQKDLKQYIKMNKNSNYLSDFSKDERKVFGSAICGKKGKMVWYIAMGTSKSVNSKGQKAIKSMV